MVEAIINYIPELIGGSLLVLLTFALTRITEKSKTKEQLFNQKEKYRSEKENCYLNTMLN